MPWILTHTHNPGVFVKRIRTRLWFAGLPLFGITTRRKSAMEFSSELDARYVASLYGYRFHVVVK